MIIEVESEHHVRFLDHALRQPHFGRVARRVSADTSLTKRVRTADLPQSRRLNVDHLIIDELLPRLVLH